MAPVELSLSADMAAAAAVLVVSYILIFTEAMHRTSVAIIGSVVMIMIGMSMGFYTQEAAITAIDGNTLLLLAGMMMMVGMLRPTGAFEYTAIRMAKLARGDARLLLIYISLAVSLISMVLDNVTTVIIFAPLTILITRILKLNPMPYLMAEAILSNIGGASTLVGDPPNLMIGSVSGIDFTSFLLHMGPIILLTWVATIGLLLLLFRHQLGQSAQQSIDLDENKAITDSTELWKILMSLGLIVTLFFIHHHLHLYPAFAAFIGLALALVLIQPKIDALFGEVNWSVLLFFAGLFIIVGGVEASGLLHLVGQELAVVAQQPGKLLMASLILMWGAAVLSAAVDNIPFTVAMIPIIVSLESHGINITPLWWALAIGVGLGGNGTHIGATANLIVVAESEKCGLPEARITPIMWLRIGLPAMFSSLIVASVFYAVFFEFFL
ncbi:MAG: ArsB/NhaD family transporter [Candidatus Polarisedimenticolaceae bacterium]|nr:ArsB/NhaD family transporter [Candidatus Polarisedimenticolaceae bacterium]